MPANGHPVWGNWSPCGYVKWVRKFLSDYLESEDYSTGARTDGTALTALLSRDRDTNRPCLSFDGSGAKGGLIPALLNERFPGVSAANRTSVVGSPARADQRPRIELLGVV